MKPLADIRTWATLRHGDQRYGELPYCIHLMECEFTAREFFPDDEQLHREVWGHDLKEDRGVTGEELVANGFTQEEADDIEGVTDEPGETRDEKKLKTLPKTRRRYRSIKLKLVDRLTNVRHSRRTGNLRKLATYRHEEDLFEAYLFDESHSELLPIWKALWAELREEGEPEKITLSEAAALLRGYRNKGFTGIFTAEFVKRTNGEVRVMNCRFGVRKYARSGKLSYDPDKRRLLPVCDVQIAAQRPVSGKKANPYRMINLDGLLEIRIDKQSYTVCNPRRPVA